MKQPSADFVSRNPPIKEPLYDVVIVGGGMVGSSLALALAALPLKIAIIEPHLQTSKKAPGFDARAIALSWSSCRIFNGLGLWDAFKKIATPIHNIHISDKGNLGISRLSAKEMNVSALGHVIELDDVAAIIQKALLEKKCVNDSEPEIGKISIIQGKVESMQLTPQFRTLLIRSTTNKNESVVNNVQGKLVVAADGKNSITRTIAGVKTSEKKYDQVAIISTLQTQLPHNNVAFERFTDTGPVAFLPLSDHRISLVWMLDKDTAKSMEDATETKFIETLQSKFGQRLGRITKVGERFCYPLSLVKSDQCRAERLAIIGNAAQSLHPIAGQGFNLGLRDVATLCDQLRLCCEQTLDPGADSVLEKYQQWRATDRSSVINFTDFIARLFLNDSKLLTTPRNAALLSLNVIPSLRQEIAKSAMGLTGKQPRLVRGLNLELEAS